MSKCPHDEPYQLEELAAAQEALILHAMAFPALRALVYSTCSIHERENEEVVRAVLAKQSRFVLEPALPFWHRRGNVLRPASAEHTEIGRCCVRCKYPDDGTIGFFVCRFVLGSSGQAAEPENRELMDAFMRLARLRQKRDEARAEAGRPGNKRRRGDAEWRVGAGGRGEASTSGACVRHVSSPVVQPSIPQWRLERDAKKQKKQKF